MLLLQWFWLYPGNTAAELPACSVCLFSAVSGRNLNDLSRESEDCVSHANLDPRQLEEEKNKLLAEAAAELREENTRQEKILQVAKRLAVLRGQDPEKGGYHRRIQS